MLLTYQVFTCMTYYATYISCFFTCLTYYATYCHTGPIIQVKKLHIYDNKQTKDGIEMI